MPVPFDSYFERFPSLPRLISEQPSSDLGLVVVIPCFNEPDLLGSLESLRACDLPACAVEVIVVVNSSETSPPEALRQNLQTLAETRPWIAAHSTDRLRFHLVHTPRLPRKRAGVGLARKIGMDEALRRFALCNRRDGLIACFDADCRCDPNYLTAIEEHFRTHPSTPGCMIYFEHPFAGDLDPAVYERIVEYELHLRYYVQALRFAGCPHAFHTVGSCMVVRAQAYAAHGGMNTRQAGEDFYFLQKIIADGGFTDLVATRVLPSPRCSDRVPFGTGRAITDSLRGRPLQTYALESFLDLRELFRAFQSGRPETFSFSEPLNQFLHARQFPTALDEAKANTAGEAALRKRLLHWFNPFMILKWMHFARDHFYGPRDVAAEARRLADRLSPPAPHAAKDLLLFFRRSEISNLKFQISEGAPR